MKRLLPILLLSFLATSAFSQSTSLRVYSILQDKCASCHSGANPAANLDLQGSGANPATDVYNRLVTDGTVANSHAQSKGYKQIYPGRSDLSFMFRKINEGLEPTISLNPAEHDDSTPHGDKGLTNVEKELLRQWVLFGAPSTGIVVDEDLLDRYYNVNGIPSFPQGPPAAPDPSEGFQVKMGPFFLKDEVGYNEELYTKYDLNLGNEREIVRFETFMSPSSHHFIMYSFSNNSGAAMPAGFRPNANHTQTKLVSAVQQPTNLQLPLGSAFKWETDQVIDLNSHYINYNGLPYAAEVYVNVYTQSAGIAAQEMNAVLFPNTSICIPNDEQEHTSTQHLTPPLGNVYMWGLMGHTHKYGTGYKVWERVNGQKGDLLYDASCPNGTPGCPSPSFDYEHIPLMYINPFLPIDMSSGLVHEANWVNDGPDSVCWGDTSDDEMMVLIGFYLTDTTGVTQNETPSAIEDFENPLDGLQAFPNPMSDQTLLSWPSNVGEVDVSIFDLLGQEVKAFKSISNNQLTINRSNLTTGIYLYEVADKNGNKKTGKLIIR